MSETPDLRYTIGFIEVTTADEETILINTQHIQVVEKPGDFTVIRTNAGPMSPSRYVVRQSYEEVFSLIGNAEALKVRGGDQS